MSLASTEGLFGGERTFLLVGALYGEQREEFVEMLEAFAESPHTFILEEEKLLKPEERAVLSAGGKIEVQAKVERKAYAFDQYGVAGALGERDKKKLWLALMQAFRAGEKPEAVAGLMCWKARSIKNVALSRELVKLYHDSHRGAGELELLLERFALKL